MPLHMEIPENKIITKYTNATNMGLSNTLDFRSFSFWTLAVLAGIILAYVFSFSKRERRETLSRMHESMLNLGALDSEVFENARKSFMDIKFSFLGKKLARESLIVVKEEDDCGDEDGEEDETKPCNNETTERTIHEKSFGDKAKSESSLHARNDQSEQFNLQPEEMNVPRRRHTDSSTGVGNVQKSKMNQWMRQRPNWKANSDGTHSWGVKGGTHIYK